MNHLNGKRRGVNESRNLKVNEHRNLTLSPLSPGAPTGPVSPRFPYKKESKT